MKIAIHLTVPLERAVDAEKRWLQLGGGEAALWQRAYGGTLAFRVLDEATADGKLLKKLAAELGATEDGETMLTRTAEFDAEDMARAELIYVTVGSISNAIDPKTKVEFKLCGACGSPVLERPKTIQLGGKKLAKVDLFHDQTVAFFGERVVDALNGMTGLAAAKTKAPAGVGPFFEVHAKTDLGYFVRDGVTWGPPCGTCKRLTRKTNALGVLGLEQFPRKAWDGSDFVTSAVVPTMLFVSQRAWRVLSEGKWRTVEPGVNGRPVVLLDGVAPIR